MTMPELPAGAIDLADVKRRADERDRVEAEAAEQKTAEEATERFLRWDRATRRAFKGIVPAPERRRALLRALELQDEANA